MSRTVNKRDSRNMERRMSARVGTSRGKSSIHIKKSHEGLLHKDTGTPAGEKIPLNKIKAAENSSDPKVRRRAQFADNARHFKH